MPVCYRSIASSFVLGPVCVCRSRARVTRNPPWRLHDPVGTQMLRDVTDESDTRDYRPRTRVHILDGDSIRITRNAVMSPCPQTFCSRKSGSSALVRWRWKTVTSVCELVKLLFRMPVERYKCRVNLDKKRPIENVCASFRFCFSLLFVRNRFTTPWRHESLVFACMRFVRCRPVRSSTSIHVRWTRQRKGTWVHERACSSLLEFGCRHSLKKKPQTRKS